MLLSSNDSQLRKLFIETHGCQMNEYDSAGMANVLQKSHQLTLVQQSEEADVILLNTCSIREKAQEKVFSQLGRWQTLKNAKPWLIIGVGGCVASQEGSEILKRAPFVDIVFGPQTLHRLPLMIAQVCRSRKPVVDISFPEIEKFDYLPTPRAEGVKAFVSIMEGCSKYCSFCVVPYTRGEEVSRPLDDVLAEVAFLAEQGVKEVTLLGQNVNDYQGLRNEGGIADLADLIRYIAALDEIVRIRFTTSHPLAFSNRLIQAYAEIPKLANHLHLPVQSGSNRILAAMKRGYTAQQFYEKIQRLREFRPDISVSSDFIVGFPSESDEEFLETLELVQKTKFDGAFSFIYSPRPGTPAAKLIDNVDHETKRKRLQILQSRLKQQASVYSQRMIGTVQNILVERPSRKNKSEMQGRTENNRMVNFSGSESLTGQLVRVLITDAFQNSLKGQLLI